MTRRGTSCPVLSGALRFIDPRHKTLSPFQQSTKGTAVRHVNGTRYTEGIRYEPCARTCERFARGSDGEGLPSRVYRGLQWLFPALRLILSLLMIWAAGMSIFTPPVERCSPAFSSIKLRFLIKQRLMKSTHRSFRIITLVPHKNQSIQFSLDSLPGSTLQILEVSPNTRTQVWSALEKSISQTWCFLFVFAPRYNTRIMTPFLCLCVSGSSQWSIYKRHHCKSQAEEGDRRSGYSLPYLGSPATEQSAHLGMHLTLSCFYFCPPKRQLPMV